MTPLAVFVPSQLEAAIAWSGGDARWLSACWSCCGDAPWLDDGRSAGTGNPWGMLAWLRHPAIAPALAGADLGSSEADGTQRLVFDRRNRQVYLADANEARAVVKAQWPAEEPVALTPEEWDGVVARIRHALLNRPIPTADDLMRLLRAHASVVADMVRAIDEWAAGGSDGDNRRGSGEGRDGDDS